MNISQEDVLLAFQDMIDEGEAVVVSDTIQCYENGKTWECPCGHGIGTKYDGGVVKCASCGLILIDDEWQDREPPEVEKGQSTLEIFI